MMRADEEGTLALLKAHRRELIDPKISENRGRIVRSTGDGLLAEFFSAVDALRCAVEIQRGMLERNRRTAARTDLRIGVNVGDAIIDEGDIFGDAVNIAARLEAAAPVGGICVSERVREDAHGKVDVEFEDGGLQRLKNIDLPVHVHRVRFATDTDAIAPRPDALDPLPPGRPSIAVMPLRNASGDPGDEYLADGITEDLITSLSRFSTLFVVARNTSFAFKGQPTNVRRVAGDLGVRFVIEGGVRRTDEQLGIGVRLYDGESGAEIWVERYDRPADEMFNVLDEVVRNVVGRVAPHVEGIEYARAARKRPLNLAAHRVALRAWLGVQRAGLGPEAGLREQAVREAREALSMDDRSILALDALAMAHWQMAFVHEVADVDACIEEGLRYAQQAIQVDRSDHWGYLIKGLLLALTPGQESWAEATEDCRRAQELNPNDAMVLYALGWMEATSGNAIPAVEHLGLFLRCNPRDPWVPNVQLLLSLASFVMCDYRAGIEWANLAPAVAASSHNVAACHVGLGNLDQAKAAIQQAKSLSPETLAARLNGTSVFRRPEDRRRHTLFLRIAAGLEDPDAADELR